MNIKYTIAAISLFVTPFVVGQVEVSSVSESGDSLALRRVVELTTDGVKALHLRRDVDEAYRLFGEAIRVDSTYAPANYSMADVLMNYDPARAEKHAREAYLSDTTNSRYLGLYAQAAIGTGRYGLASELYEKLLELSPLDINGYRLLAILYQEQSRPHDAISLLDTAEMRVGRNSYLAALKQQLLLSTGQGERATEEAQAAVEEYPNSPDYRVSLAQLLMASRRDSLAQLHLDAAMDLDPRRIETLLAQANFHLLRGRDREYLQMINRVVLSDGIEVSDKVGLVKEITARRELYQREPVAVGSVVSALSITHPTEPEVVTIQAHHLIAQGLYAQSSQYLKSHLDDEPAQIDYYRLVIELGRHMEQLDSVELYLNRAMARFPEIYSLKYDMASLHMARYEFDEAAECYKSTLGYLTDSLQSSVWGSVGDILYTKLQHDIAVDEEGELTQRQVDKRLKEIFKSYRKAISLFEDNVMVLNNYAYFLCENGGDLNEALKLAERVMALDDGNSTFIDTYAWILYRMGRYDEAKASMRRAVTLDSTRNYEIALHYAEILAVLNEMTMAEFYWGRALQWGASAEQVESSRNIAQIRREQLLQQQDK